MLSFDWCGQEVPVKQLRSVTEGIYSGHEMCAARISALGGFWSDGPRCHSFGLITESQASQMVQWVKNQPAMQEACRKCRFDPLVRKIPEGGPRQYSCLEKLMDKGAWQSTVHRVAELDTTEVTEHACD